MNERFKTLLKLEKNLFTKGAPIIISTGLLLKDMKTDNVITQLKFQSVSDKKIIALKIIINAFDISGNSITKDIEYQYLDLNIFNGDFFGFDKAIVMPDNITRNIQIEKIMVVFEEDLCEFSGDGFQPLESQERLEAKMSPELVKQYQIDASTTGEFIPKEIDQLWLCSCQTPNATLRCACCNAKKEDVFSAYNLKKLETNLKKYNERQKELEETKRQEEEQLNLIEQCKIKKKKKIVSLMGICVALLLGVVLITNIIIDKMHYKKVITEIERYINDEQYEEAFDVINNNELKTDDEEIYREKVIPHMQELHKKIRNSEDDNLACIIDKTEYYIGKNSIYCFKDGEGRDVLYRTPSDSKYLRCNWSIYANGCIFFVEGEEYISYEPYDKSCKYTAKYINLKSKKTEILGSANSRGDIVKLDSGCIFIGLNILNFNEGIWYNPYNKSKYIGENVVTDGELEDAIYMN